MTVNPEIVGDNTDIAGAEQAIAHNSQIIAEAASAESAASEEKSKLETDDVDGDAPKAKGNTEAGVYADIASGAIGSSVVNAVKVAADIISDSDPGSYGGVKTMEDLAKGTSAKKAAGSSSASKDILGNKVSKSIHTSFFNDIAGRGNGIADFLSGKDKIKGVKANEQSIAALHQTQKMQLSSQVLSRLHLGNAVQKKAQLGAQMGQARQQGIGLGGGLQHLNKHMKPTGPTDDITRDAAVSESGATDWV